MDICDHGVFSNFLAISDF